MVQRKLRRGVRRGLLGAQPTARRLHTAAVRRALRWGAGPARRAKRRLFDGFGHDSGRGSGGVEAESSSVESLSVARQQDMPRFVTPFAGVSVFADCRLSSSTRSVVNSGAASGYHLLVVDGYSETKKIYNSMALRSRPFIVGGHRWCIDYLPNGTQYADYISLFVVLLDDDAARPVKVWFRFSFIDEVEKQEVTLTRAAYTSTFCSNDTRRGETRFIKRDVLEQSENLKNDCFTIRFDIMICEDLNTEVPLSGMSQVPLSGMSQHFNHLLQTKVGADVTFEVSGETFAAHRCVLAARSTVFMAQLFGSTKEGTEADVIQITDMKAKVFKDLLCFIYTDAFPEMEREESEDYEMWLQWLEDLIVAADRYDLQHLRFSCEYLLSDCLGKRTVPKILDIAVQHHCYRLKEACLQFLQDLSSSGLQTVMATHSWKHIIPAYPYILNEIIAKPRAKFNASDNPMVLEFRMVKCLQFLQNLSSSRLPRLMATNSWKRIILAYPYVLKELIAKLVAKCNASDNATLLYGFSLPSSN